MKLYLAQAEGRWLQRVDGNLWRTVDEFRAHVAHQFGLNASLVTVIEREGDEAVALAMGTGTFEGLPVTAAPAAPPPPPTKRDHAIAAIDRASKDKDTSPAIKAAFDAIREAL